MKTNNISMNCTHEGVTINFNFGRGPVMAENGVREFSVRQNASIDGYNVDRTDRYDITGKRLTEAVKAEKVFTEAYYTELDGMAQKFAALINETL